MVASRASTAAQVQLAHDIEAEVFGAWFGNTPEQLAEEYGPYESASTFFLARRADVPLEDLTGVVAASRLVAPGPAGNKTLRDVAGDPWRADGPALALRAGMVLDRTWDVATVVALPRGQATGAAGALYAAMYAHLASVGAGWWTSLIDSVVLELARAAGLPCEPLPTLRPGPYLGSPATVPVFGAVADIDLTR